MPIKPHSAPFDAAPKSDVNPSEIVGFLSDLAPKPTLTAKKYLIFNLKDVDYGVPLIDVREIVGLPKFVSIPGTPPYFLGMINLRGRVISAIDLLKKLSPTETGTTSKRPAMIITESQSITLGCAVDKIKEVLLIHDSQIDRTCEIDHPIGKSFIQGIARFENRPMIILINLVQVADVTEIVRVRGQLCT